MIRVDQLDVFRESRFKEDVIPYVTLPILRLGG